MLTQQQIEALVAKLRTANRRSLPIEALNLAADAANALWLTRKECRL
jgi:hypothetical protein